MGDDAPTTAGAETRPGVVVAVEEKLVLKSSRNPFQQTAPYTNALGEICDLVIDRCRYYTFAALLIQRQTIH